MSLELMMTPRRKTGKEFLWIDPSDQATGQANVVVDRKGLQTGIVAANISVVEDGPFSGAKSLYFDSSSTRATVRIPSAKLLNLLTGDFTAECWFKVTTDPTGNGLCLLGNWIQATGKGGLVVFARPSQRIDVGWGPFSENNNLISVANVWNLNSWNHVAVTRLGSTFTLWVNGVSKAMVTTTTTRGSIGAEFDLGTYQNASAGIPDSVSKVFTGWLTGVRLNSGYAKYRTAFTPRL